MNDDQFMKLFKEIQSVKTNLERHAEASRLEHADIRGAVSKLAGLIKDYHQEMIMRSPAKLTAWNAGFTKLPKRLV